MKRPFSIILLALASLSAVSQVSFVGTDKNVIEIKPGAETGLQSIYVLNNTESVKATYSSKTGSANVKWYKFGETGGAFAEQINDVSYNGTESILDNIQGNRGYYIEDGPKRFYFWLVDYSAYQFKLNNAAFATQQDCGAATLMIDAQCKPILYYSITGVPKTLSRDITISYTTLEWNEDNSSFLSKDAIVTFENISNLATVPAPLCNTVFEIEGDRFLKTWGMGTAASTDLYQTKSIDIHTSVIQENRDNPNEQKGDATTLGGSAPADIVFSSFTTDAVVFKEWQISRDSEFKNILYRFNEGNLTYSFRDEGTFYVRFLGSNDDASCSVESEAYAVSIGESVLECPNAFSPDASPGVNDEWKVSYKSITSFKCWIFDRYGTQIVTLNEPSQGWDGKYKGKYVKPGVYYYVIEAMGADGKEYKLKGDINILKSKNFGNHESVQ